MLVKRVLENRRIIKENEAYRTGVRDWQRGRERQGQSHFRESFIQWGGDPSGAVVATRRVAPCQGATGAGE